ncbi:hypothetical protein [Pontibacter sp. G13]|uniref:hypothetical protein n=1 Tax=Pontibacter sp. G13 TaxID=3074898 RepID=UPI002889782C|nr:hypothetical protein [Pontibacter sp. G13]WNJ17136.1 hypothetical protein RJD25_19955 [Pontibacter sp. G13]
MKTVLPIIFTVLIFHVSFGQVATIQDPDGWTNVRKAPDGKSEVIHKIFEHEVFWYDFGGMDQEQAWISIYIPKHNYSLGKSEPNFIVGFIHRSRLLKLEQLEEYAGIEFQFDYQLSDFDSTDRVIDRQGGQWVVAIDGRPVWGTDGNFPKTQVDDIKVRLNGKEIVIHEVFYSDIFECGSKLSIYKNGDTYFVHQSNSDGAGGYEIVWVLDKNGLKQRLVGTMI